MLTTIVASFILFYVLTEVQLSGTIHTPTPLQIGGNLTTHQFAVIIIN